MATQPVVLSGGQTSTAHPPRREYIRAYQREWVAKRRRMWLEGKRCSRCGSTDRLELHHVDPSTKISHQFWSWRRSRFEAEVSKCIPLCSDCHAITTAAHRALRAIGVYQLHDKPRNLPFRAKITRDNRFVHIGYFATREEAAAAYRAKALEMYGSILFPALTMS